MSQQRNTNFIWLKLITFLFAGLWVHGAMAYIHPPSTGASHDLEEAAQAMHDYLHDNYASTYGAHDFEEAAHELHNALHDWSEGNANESRVATQLKNTMVAWKEFRQQIKGSRLLHTDDTVKQLFRNTQKTYKQVRFLLQKASSLAFIPSDTPGASHELEEASTELHDYLHDNYDSTFGAHDFEEASHALHDGLHNWSLGQVSEDEVADLFDATKGSWVYFEYQLGKAGLKHGPDGGLNMLYRNAKNAFKRVSHLLRKVD